METVVLERLVRELNGVECDGFKPEPEASKATAVTRQFGVPVTKLDKLCEAMVRRAAEKIRHQGLVSDVADRVYARALPPNPPSASRQTRMSPPSNDQRIIAGLAAKMMEAMYQPGGVYTKCGILLEELLVRGAGQGDSFAVQDPRARRLLAAMDGLNDRFGRGTVGNAAQGFGARAFDTKRGQKSPAWTTRLAEIPVAR